MWSAGELDKVASSTYYHCHCQLSTKSGCLFDLPPPNVQSSCSSCRSRWSTSGCRHKQCCLWDPQTHCILLWAMTVKKLVLRTNESHRGGICVGRHHGCRLWPRWHGSLRRLILLGTFHICDPNASAVVSLLWFISHLIMRGGVHGGLRWASALALALMFLDVLLHVTDKCV